MARPRRDAGLDVAIGKRMAEARRARGLTQAELAEAVGVETVTVSRWETGVRAPTVSMLVHIAEELRVGVEGLVGGHVKVEAEMSPRVASILRTLMEADQEVVDLVDVVLRKVIAMRDRG